MKIATTSKQDETQKFFKPNTKYKCIKDVEYSGITVFVAGKKYKTDSKGLFIDELKEAFQPGNFNSYFKKIGKKRYFLVSFVHISNGAEPVNYSCCCFISKKFINYDLFENRMRKIFSYEKVVIINIQELTEKDYKQFVK